MSDIPREYKIKETDATAEEGETGRGDKPASRAAIKLSLLTNQNEVEVEEQPVEVHESYMKR